MRLERPLVLAMLFTSACGPASADDGSGGTSSDTAGTIGPSSGDSGVNPTTSDSGIDPTVIPTTGDVPPDPGDDTTSTGAPPACETHPPGTIVADVTVEPPPGEFAWANSLAVDTAGRAHVAGSLALPGSSQPVLVRIDRDGAVLGVHLHTPGAPGGQLRGIVVDGLGQVVVGGERDLDGEAGYLASFAADGSPGWSGLLPGSPGRRRISDLALAPSGALIAAGDDLDGTFWVTSFLLGEEDVLWTTSAAGGLGGTVRVTAGTMNESVALHGGWDEGTDRKAQYLLLAPDGAMVWDLQRPPNGDIGTISAVALSKKSDILHLTSAETPVSSVDVTMLRVDANQKWRTFLAETPEAREIGHELWTTPEGLVQVLVSRHISGPGPTPVEVELVTLDSGGVVLDEVTLDLDITTFASPPALRATPGPCGALWVWDSVAGRLWSVQL